MLRIILAIICIQFLHNKILGQSFFRIELIRIENKLILPENFTQIKLPEVILISRGLNKYVCTNNDTYLQIIENDRHERYHILIQKDFIGNITYLAVSNLLSKIILKKTNPTFIFDQCLQTINDGYIDKGENLLNAIACIIDRAELCNERK